MRYIVLMLRGAFTAILMILPFVMAAGRAPAPATKPAAAPTLASTTRQQIATVLDELQQSSDYAAAHKSLAALFDQSIAYSLPKDVDVLRDVDFGLRMVSQLETLAPAKRGELLKFLRANENLARTVVFLINPRQDPRTVYLLLDRLRETRGKQLEEFASLTAAICVVQDRPLERAMNENKVKSADPLAIFDYYAQNEPRMFFGIKPVPAELLIYVVDTTAQVDEMNWALANYANDAKVGARFFDIRYDYSHYRRGTEKRITQEGFNLPNIRRYGGVCIDQAYFATSIGKAIGVPTALVYGASAKVAHAWVGFLESGGRSGWWNFDTGRYEEYKGVRGMVFDPQLRQEIPDSFVSLLAEMIGSKLSDRHNAVALTDAAARLMEIEGKRGSFEPTAPAVSSGISLKGRKADLAAELELLEMAVKQNPGDRWSWVYIRELAKSGRLSLDQKKKWADALQRLCGNKYPDFALAILAPMIQTVDDVNEQNKLWNAAFAMFQSRADLAAYIRMSQAVMWEKHNDVNNAGRCYEDVIQRYANAGPFVIDALQKAERALRNSNRANLVPVLYEQTWARIARPKESDSPFMTQSNWFRVGVMLVLRLGEAGDARRAEVVRNMLGNPEMEVQPAR